MGESNGALPASLQKFKFKYEFDNVGPLPPTTKELLSGFKPPGMRIRKPGKHVFRRHSRLSMAIANHDLELIDALLKDYYINPENSSQVLWSFCSLCHKFARELNMKKVVFLLKRGIREIVWRTTPDLLDIGYVLRDSLKPGNRKMVGNPYAIEGALAFALGYSPTAVIEKLVRAGACLNCLAACYSCFDQDPRRCSCVEFSPLYQAFSCKSTEKEILEIATLLIIHSGELISLSSSKPTRSKYLTEAVCVGSYKAVKLLIDAGEDPTLVANDGSTVVSTKLRMHASLEPTIAIILYMIKCHGQYSAQSMNRILYPGNILDIDGRRAPTLEFIFRMIITAILGDFDPTFVDLIRINVARVYQRENWMGLPAWKKSQEQVEAAASVLLQILRFPNAMERLALVTADWVNLFLLSLKHAPIPGPKQIPSLKQMARHVIRRNARVPLFQSLESLSALPLKMKDYVMMGEELKILVNVRTILSTMTKMENE